MHLGDGRWWDAQAGSWRDGVARVICLVVGEEDVLGSVRTTRVVQASDHRNHDTVDNTGANLPAFCRRYPMNHGRPEHQRRRRTLFRRKASGDLYADYHLIGSAASPSTKAMGMELPDNRP